MKPCILIFLFLIIYDHLPAQCPNRSGNGVHVVQKGETLYAISRLYQVSVDQLAKWNGIDPFAVLPLCRELRVIKAPETTQPPTAPAGPSRPAPTVQPAVRLQQGDWHVVRAGETIAEIAAAYGYTEARFRQFNQLNADEPARSDLVLKTNDCVCEPLSGESPEETISDLPLATAPQEDTRIDNTPRSSDQDRRQPAPAGNRFNSFEEDPFYDAPPEATVSYVNPDNRIPATSAANPYAVLVPAEEKIIPPAPDSYQTPETELAGQSPTPAPAGAMVLDRSLFPYMSDDEVAMINEINLLRSNPAGYIRQVETYMDKIRRGTAFGSLKDSRELILELRQTPPLPVLHPVRCLYNAALLHGKDQQPTGFTDHMGTDGSFPWDRIRKACPYMTDGEENIVGGPESVRDALMLLLIDEGVPSRAHRRTLLNKEWVYVAAYKIGRVGTMPNSWIQKFGK